MRRMTRLGLGFPKNAASSSSFPRLGHWRFSIRTGLHVEHFKTAPSTAPTRDESSPIKHGSRQSYGSVHTRSHGILWTWVGEKSQNEKKRSLRKRKREVVPFCGAYTAPSRVYHPRTKRDIVSYGFGSDGRRVDNMYSASNSRTLNHR